VLKGNEPGGEHAWGLFGIKRTKKSVRGKSSKAPDFLQEGSGKNGTPDRRNCGLRMEPVHRGWVIVL